MLFWVLHVEGFYNKLSRSSGIWLWMHWNFATHAVSWRVLNHTHVWGVKVTTGFWYMCYFLSTPVTSLTYDPVSNIMFKNKLELLHTTTIQAIQYTVNFTAKGSDWKRLIFAHPFPLNSGAPIASANFILFRTNSMNRGFAIRVGKYQVYQVRPFGVKGNHSPVQGFCLA